MNSMINNNSSDWIRQNSLSHINNPAVCSNELKYDDLNHSDSQLIITHSYDCNCHNYDTCLSCLLKKFNQINLKLHQDNFSEEFHQIQQAYQKLLSRIQHKQTHNQTAIDNLKFQINQQIQLKQTLQSVYQQYKSNLASIFSQLLQSIQTKKTKVQYQLDNYYLSFQNNIDKDIQKLTIQYQNAKQFDINLTEFQQKKLVDITNKDSFKIQDRNLQFDHQQIFTDIKQFTCRLKDIDKLQQIIHDLELVIVQNTDTNGDQMIVDQIVDHDQIIDDQYIMVDQVLDDDQIIDRLTKITATNKNELNNNAKQKQIVKNDLDELIGLIEDVQQIKQSSKKKVRTQLTSEDTVQKYKAKTIFRADYSLKPSNIRFNIQNEKLNSNLMWKIKSGTSFDKKKKYSIL